MTREEVIEVLEDHLDSCKCKLEAGLYPKDEVGEEIINALNFAINSIKVDVAYDFEFEKTEEVLDQNLYKDLKWILISEKLPEEGEPVIGITTFYDVYKAKLYDDCGKKKWYANGHHDVPIIAWIPLPSYAEIRAEKIKKLEEK